MKIKEHLDKSFLKRSTRMGVMLVLVAAVTLEATALIQYFFSRRGLLEEATLRAESQLEATENRIMDIIDQTETAVRNTLWIAQWALDYPDSLASVSRRLVEDNPVVFGSTVALVPGYYRDKPLFAPYVYEGKDGLVFRTLATEEYDYPSQEWFSEPLRQNGGYWSEPYIDKGGGEKLMTTYSLPIKDTKGRTAAVLTADVSLAELSEMIGDVKIFPEAFSMIVSREGQIMASPEETLVIRASIEEMAARMDDTSGFKQLNRAMLSGESGTLPLKVNGVKSYIYFAPVERTGWSMSIVVPEKEIYSGIRKIDAMVKALQLLGLAMLILILRSFFKSQLKYRSLNERKKRMEGELQIARDIQMAMVPKVFPPFPERNDLDIAASIVPAKQVGGDLYDYFIRDNRLFFCIGDVSGKGIPASLVMAMTRSIFRSVSAHEDNPANIVAALNRGLSEMNESNMFVTFFCGVLDLSAGTLRYCNAGHNAPMIVSDALRSLPVEPNLALGIDESMQYREQESRLRRGETIYLYTDGVTEAENSEYELFGTERMAARLAGGGTAEDYLESVQAGVSDFVGKAPQSDDMTQLVIRYLGDAQATEDTDRLLLHNDIQEIRRLGAFVETIADGKGLEHGVAAGLNLALEEAVTNVILYAYPEGTDGFVEIRYQDGPGSMEFIVSDAGKPFDPTAVPDADVTQDASERKIGGLGIFLVRQIMDEVGYERKDGKNILSLKKYI